MNKKMQFKLDYYSFTFPFECHVGDVKELIIEDVVEMVGKFFNIDKSLVKREQRPTNRYQYQYTLGESITLRLYGPEDFSGFHTCQIELKGEGCREFEARCQDKNWSDLFFFSMILNGKTTRLDLAIDDYSNQLPLEWIDNKLDKRFYTSPIKAKAKPIGRFTEGYSITMGSNDSPTQICIYDKKYEQEAKGNPVLEDSWTRYELRFRGQKANQVRRQLYKVLGHGEEYDESKMKELFLGLLYQSLDIKKDNNYSKSDQSKVDTDPMWLDFIDNANKVVLPPLEKKVPSLDGYFARYTSTVVSFLLFLYIIKGQDFETFEHVVYKLLYENTELDAKRYHRLNIYLEKLTFKSITDKDIQKIKGDFFGKMSELELPF